MTNINIEKSINSWKISHLFVFLSIALLPNKRKTEINSENAIESRNQPVYLSEI